MASERLALGASGQVRYTLKTPYRDGTTQVVLEPLELMARLRHWCRRSGAWGQRGRRPRIRPNRGHCGT